MDHKKELKRLVEIVKNNAKKNGIKLTNEQLAERFGVKRTYLSDLLGSHGEVTEKHVALFRQKFASELGDTEVSAPFSADDPLNVERAKVAALERKLAMVMSMVYEMQGRNRTYEECFEDIEHDTIVILNDLRRLGK